MKSFLIKIALMAVLLSFCFIQLNAQDDNKKHLIGVQGNIYLNSNLFTGASIDYVYALRYGYKINRNISVGPEFSGWYSQSLIDNSLDMRSYCLKFGGFARYTFMPEKRVNLFIEASPYLMFTHYIPGADPVFQNVSERKDYKFTGYLAPGVSIISKSRRVSLDLMYKFTNTSFVYSKKHDFTFRFNFHF